MADGRLHALACPSCGQALTGDSHKTTGCFEDCARRCDECGIGFSNARRNPTLIYRDPTMNVPSEFRPGLTDAVEHALNILNRSQKRIKLGFSTSEDAITWTVFSALTQSDRTAALWHALTGEAADPDWPPRLLLWGVPLDTGDEPGWRLRQQLEQVSDALGEDPRRRTEPDVVIDAGAAGIAIIEVKYMSSNDVKAPNSRFDRYLDTSCFSDPDAAKATGLYELIRNWRFGCEIAQGRRFVLVNLVRHRDLLREKRRLSDFPSHLATNDRRQFALIEWERLLDQLDLLDTPEMRAYLSDRFSL